MLDQLAPSSERIIIRPTRGWTLLRLRDVWEYREMLYFLVWRDVKVRYSQTLLGAAWAILQPLLTMVVFSVVFGRFVGVPSDGVPYPVFAYCGLLPWQFFAQGLTQGGNSLVANEKLITKVYFPRLVIPIAAVVGGVLDFCVAFLILLVLMAHYGIPLTAAAVTLPFFLLLALATALGVALWLAALNVEYRDVRYTIQFLTQFWLFATPVAYPASVIPERWHALVGLNPMAGVVEGFRWALIGTAQPSGSMLAVSGLVVCALLLSGLYYFRRMERTFADVI